MLPVFIHHELDEKPQTGGKANQAYVKTCIAQAKKYNNEVVLFGDKSNQSYSEKWVDVSNFTSTKWEKFLSVFENYSTYPVAWAKAIFKRFFIFEKYMRQHNIEKCIILDSDVLVWCNFEELDYLKSADAAMEIPERQNIEILPFPNELRCAACIGMGMMTIETISDFNDYCIDVYSHHKEKLLEKWNVHLEYGLPGGVCEMSLLYLWWKDRMEKFRIVNLGMKYDHVYPCVVVNTKGESYEVGVKFKTVEKYSLKGNCLVSFQNGYPYVYEENMSKCVKTLGLHFGGNSKIFINNFAKAKTYSGFPLLDWYYWGIRNKLSLLKRRLSVLKRQWKK